MKLTPRQKKIKRFLQSGILSILLVLFIWSLKSCVAMTSF